MIWWCLVFCMLHSLYHLSDGLKLTNLYVPGGASSYEVQIDCKYKLDDGETLYDVKWYKDDLQFFRCSADGTVHEFPVDGISLDYQSKYAALGSCPVKLTGLTGNSAGKYRCEVSLDGPTFRTVSETKLFRFTQYSRQIQDDDVGHSTMLSNQNQTSSIRNGCKSFRAVVYLVILFVGLCRFLE